MQIEVIYRQGRVEFLEQIRLKHDQFRTFIELPNEEIIANYGIIDPISFNETFAPSALDLLLKEDPNDPWLQRMKTIEVDVLAIPETQLPNLTPKQQQYLNAFILREDR